MDTIEVMARCKSQADAMKHRPKDRKGMTVIKATVDWDAPKKFGMRTYILTMRACGTPGRKPKVI